MDNDEKVLQILTQMQGDISDLMQGQAELRTDVAELKEDVRRIDKKVELIDKTVIRIENNHGEKLAVLFDGQKQNSQLLETIKEEVSRHEEVILRKVL